MGTSWSVKLARPVNDTLATEIQQRIEAELDRINQLMSTYDKTSELSLFNNAADVGEYALHEDTLAVIDAAYIISEQTDGAYDVTLGPVIELWGFGQARLSGDLPSADDVLAAFAKTGYRKLQRSGNMIARTIPGMRVDLSSIAKGFAVDQLGVALEQMGIDRYSVEIGGELRTRGLNAGDATWKIGIEQPDGTMPHGIAVENSHIASSGDYRNYHEIDGVRYSHIIDGRTGYPIRHNVAAVTVVHGNSTMLADAWATALMVLPVEQGKRLAEQHGLAIQLTVKQGEGFIVIRNDAFDRLLLN